MIEEREKKKEKCGEMVKKRGEGIGGGKRKRRR